MLLSGIQRGIKRDYSGRCSFLLFFFLGVVVASGFVVVVVEVVSLGHVSSGLPLAFQDGMDGPSISWNRLGLGESFWLGMYQRLDIPCCEHCRYLSLVQ